MRTFLIIFIFISTIFSQADVKITDSKISFIGSHPFHDWTGISTDLKLDLNCSDKDEPCHYLFSVPWTSFDSGNDNRDNNMLYYVNAYEFHNIKMTFKDVKLDSVQQYNSEAHILEATLSIAGVNKLIYIPIKFEFTESYYELQSEFSLKVSDFNIERPTLLMIPINDEIIIKVKFSGEILIN